MTTEKDDSETEKCAQDFCRILTEWGKRDDEAKKNENAKKAPS